MTFEEWWKLHRPGYPGRDKARAFARWAWQEATRQEQERCCALIASISTDPGLAEPTTAYLVGRSCIRQIMDGTTLQD